MGLFNKLFVGGEKVVNENDYWIPLIEKDQIDEIKQKSSSKVQLIFKHSTRCGISKMTIRSFENMLQQNLDTIDYYYLDLLSYRNISDLVGEIFQVFHQSPQVIIIKNGETVAHASHHDITRLNLENY